MCVCARTCLVKTNPFSRLRSLSLPSAGWYTVSLSWKCYIPELNICRVLNYLQRVEHLALMLSCDYCVLTILWFELTKLGISTIVLIVLDAYHSTNNGNGKSLLHPPTYGGWNTSPPNLWNWIFYTVNFLKRDKSPPWSSIEKSW
jgi:hypothetical protein